MMKLFLGVDVGTKSARAGLFDEAGQMLGLGVEPIALFRPAGDFAEQSSEDIWRACGAAIRQALKHANQQAEHIAGIGFDATCSMVVLDREQKPLSISPSGDPSHNIIVWMDHRAIEQAKRINERHFDVLDYVGGRISPEMQVPKLLWLKENLPQCYQNAWQFFDLPDYLSFRATGSDIRSTCTTTCKWTYLAHKKAYNADFFNALGLSDLPGDQYKRIGAHIMPVGERCGVLSERAAQELGLVPGIAVAVSLIDAHAGGVGVLGFSENGQEPSPSELETRLALIGGTSTCHMAITQEPKFVPGVWGPYFSAMVPEFWLTEGGQSATGALIDHTIESHTQGRALAEKAKLNGSNVYSMLNEILSRLAKSEAFPAALTRDLHVLADHHGNRSPRADATLRGMVSGLSLHDSEEALSLLYMATIQSLAHGTRHILDEMNAHGHQVRTLVATGGDAKNPLFLREHADITGCRIVLPRESEAVLLGSAMLGAAASGHYKHLREAMARMSAVKEVIEPQTGAISGYHEAKHRVYLRMYEDQMAYRALMQHS